MRGFHHRLEHPQLRLQSKRPYAREALLHSMSPRYLKSSIGAPSTVLWPYFATFMRRLTILPQWESRLGLLRRASTRHAVKPVDAICQVRVMHSVGLPGPFRSSMDPHYSLLCQRDIHASESRARRRRAVVSMTSSTMMKRCQRVSV